MSSPQEPSQPAPPPIEAPPGAVAVPAYAFDELANGHKEVHILFEGQVYRLHKTRNDRLILTK
ncbi:MAG: hemin uptake protein HemP [Planctomycetaceae bacterium]|nr:hemin uptake protein HemP [Planctomycetaceae bacterium]